MREAFRYYGGRRKPPVRRIRVRRFKSRSRWQVPGWLPLAALVAASGFGYLGVELHPTSFLHRPFVASGTVPQPRGRQQAIVGRASVIDGDTIEVFGERVRFNGIDTPESRQLCKDPNGRDYRCGTVAAGALDRFLAASRPIRCDFVSRDQYGRFVGNCFRADGADVAAWLVEQGHAMDWPRYSRGAYAAEQQKAKRQRIGIWQGSLQPPWEWRRQHR